MSHTPEDLARFHLETALALTNKEFIGAWLGAGVGVAAAAAGGAGVAAGGASAPAGHAGRGRRPGAASDAERCAWKLTDGSQCKNAHHAGNSYCKIHVGKIHLIDPGQ
jgi:hypothetical protein